MNFMIIFTLWWELVRFKNKKQKNLTTYKTFPAVTGQEVEYTLNRFLMCPRVKTEG